MSGAPSSSATQAGSDALRTLERCTREIVVTSIAQGSLRGNDPAVSVSEWHDRTARMLHDVSMDHGTEAMATTTAYAVAVLNGGMLYPGDELEEFLRHVGAAVRATFRDVAKAHPAGG